jgi:hypothetical protein
MKEELNYLASKSWEKVGRQELRSTPYKQEIDPWSIKSTIYDALQRLIYRAHLQIDLSFVCIFYEMKQQ